MMITEENCLSLRGNHTFNEYDPLITYFNKSEENNYHPVNNPQGVVNLGSCVNKLMEEEIRERLSRKDVWCFDSTKHQHYYNFAGELPLRITIANFFNRYFNVSEETDPEHLVVLGGTSSCLNALAHALFDPGDAYITPVPSYGRIYGDFFEKSIVQPHPLHLPEQPDENGVQFSLTPKLLEDRILDLQNQGIRVLGLVLINPQNPLGDVYSPSLLRSLMEVCNKYKMHVIVDEIYALSLMDKTAEVTSTLSVPNVPDPERTHTIWALTKDFGLAGFRLGVIHTKNKSLLKVLRDLAIYSSTPSIVQSAAQTLLGDTRWLDETFLPLSRERLENRYGYVKARLEEKGIPVRPAKGGLFVWIDLKRFLPDSTVECERELFDEFYDNGVYVLPGQFLYCSSPGWFRIVISVSSTELSIGLERFETILKGRREIINGNFKDEKIN